MRYKGLYAACMVYGTHSGEKSMDKTLPLPRKLPQNIIHHMDVTIKQVFSLKELKFIYGIIMERCFTNMRLIYFWVNDYINAEVILFLLVINMWYCAKGIPLKLMYGVLLYKYKHPLLINHIVSLIDLYVITFTWINVNTHHFYCAFAY